MIIYKLSIVIWEHDNKVWILTLWCIQFVKIFCNVCTIRKITVINLGNTWFARLDCSGAFNNSYLGEVIKV